MMLSKPDDFEEGATPRDKQEFPGIRAKPDESASYQSEGVEFSAPLENSMPLEAPRIRYRIAQVPTAPVSPEEHTVQAPLQPIEPIRSVNETVQPESNLGLEKAENRSDGTQSIAAAKKIPLWDERLIVDRRRRKVGEIVVRKAVEIHVVEVPIRREKLIVERVSPEYEQLAVVELGQAEIQEFNSLNSTQPLPPVIKAEFDSTNEAILFLAAIASESNFNLQKLQVHLILNDTAAPATYSG